MLQCLPSNLAIMAKLGPFGLGKAPHGPDSDDLYHRHNAAVLADLDVSGVEPELWPVAFQRTLQEGENLAVDLAAQAADLTFGNPGHAHGLDQIIDRAGRPRLEPDHRVAR